MTEKLFLMTTTLREINPKTLERQGSTWEYLRIIPEDGLTDDTLRPFYSDDLSYAMKKAVEEHE